MEFYTKTDLVSIEKAYKAVISQPGTLIGNQDKKLVPCWLFLCVYYLPTLYSYKAFNLFIECHLCPMSLSLDDFGTLALFQSRLPPSMGHKKSKFAKFRSNKNFGPEKLLKCVLCKLIPKSQPRNFLLMSSFYQNRRSTLLKAF